MASFVVNYLMTMNTIIDKECTPPCKKLQHHTSTFNSAQRKQNTDMNLPSSASNRHGKHAPKGILRHLFPAIPIIPVCSKGPQVDDNRIFDSTLSAQIISTSS